MPNKNEVEWKIARGNWDKVDGYMNENDLPTHTENMNVVSIQTINIKTSKDNFC